MAKDTGTAPAPRPAEKVRNVALVGHAGAGKTTLAEALLVATGALPRAGRVEDGTTCLDTEEVEVRQQRSVSLGVATVEHAGHRITLLDTPGSPDFVGELRAGLRAADAALFVVSAVNGVDATTVQLWEECAAVGMPRAVVITQLDRARADVDEAVRLCQRHARGGRLPDAPGRPRPGRRGARPGLAARAADVDRRPERRPAPRRAHRGDHRGERGRDADGAVPGRRRAGQSRTWSPTSRPRSPAAHFHPVLCAAPLTRRRHRELLDLLVAGVPVPARSTAARRSTRPDGAPAPSLACDPDGPAGGRGRQDDHRPLPRPGLAGPGLLRHPAARHPDPRLRARHEPTAAIPTTTSTSGSARSPRRWAPRSARSRPARPGTSAPSRGSAAPRPGTRCPPRRTRGSCRPGTCPPRSCRSPSRPPPGPTRTGSRPPWPGSSPRTRPCGWSGAPTPASCCCGAWGRRTPRCSSSGCAAGTASR